MKEIRMDWETYTKEQKDIESTGQRNGILLVELWIVSDKKLWQLLEEWKCPSLERVYWRDLAQALGREDELEKPKEVETCQQ